MMNSSRPRPLAQNPFQQQHQGQAAAAAHNQQQQQFTLALQQYMKSIRQACWVICFGFILVLLLSWAVPDPPLTGDLAAPEPLPSSVIRIQQQQQRGAGGVRGQAAVMQNLSGAGLSREDKMQPLSKHWEADALEGARHDAGEEEEEDFRDEVERLPVPVQSKPHPRFVTPNQPHEIGQDLNQVAFGRSDIDESEEQESPDENEHDAASAKQKQRVPVSSGGAAKAKKSMKVIDAAGTKGGGTATKGSKLDPERDRKKRVPSNDEKASRGGRSHDRLDSQVNRTVKATR